MQTSKRKRVGRPPRRSVVPRFGPSPRLSMASQALSPSMILRWAAIPGWSARPRSAGLQPVDPWRSGCQILPLALGDPRLVPSELRLRAREMVAERLRHRPRCRTSSGPPPTRSKQAFRTVQRPPDWGLRTARVGCSFSTGPLSFRRGELSGSDTATVRVRRTTCAPHLGRGRRTERAHLAVAETHHAPLRNEGMSVHPNRIARAVLGSNGEVRCAPTTKTPPGPPGGGPSPSVVEKN